MHASSPDVWRLSLSEARSPKSEFGNEEAGSGAPEPPFVGRKNGGFFVHTKGARNSSSTGAFSVLHHTRLPELACRAGGCRAPCSRSQNSRKKRELTPSSPLCVAPPRDC